MSKKRLNVFSFLGALLTTALFYFLLSTLTSRSGATYEFFSQRGWYQYLSVFFFTYGMFLALSRFLAFGQEGASLTMVVPEMPYGREEASVLAEELEHRHFNLLGQRLANLLRGFGRGEDLGPLEDRLAANDRDALDQSLAFISWVRSLPPLIGLLGTLDGLRGGIRQIATISNAANLEAVRQRLQDFAAHASTAFDTTLLGISAAAVLSAVVFILRRNEEDHLNRVDQIGSDAVRSLARNSMPSAQLEDAVRDLLPGFLRSLDNALSASTGPMVEAYRRDLQELTTATLNGWLNTWRQELSAATSEVLKSINQITERDTERLVTAVQSNTDVIARSLRALEASVTEPKPVHLKISAGYENGVHEYEGKAR